MSEPVNFLDIVSTHFLICEEMIAEHGEDSGLEEFNECAGIFGVFDGCGGLGAMAYPRMQNKTGAYLSSRIVSAAVKDWFEESCQKGVWDRDALQFKISDYMNFCVPNCGDTAVRIKGSMIRTFPTTMAVVACYYASGKLYTKHIWAGDSRTYILTPRGLMQISRDDVEGEDALSNLSNDGVLTNVVSADGKYLLHCRDISGKSPCIMIAATDGCFGYLSSPMMFEYILIDTLIRSGNVNEWRQMLLQELGQYSEDDYTLSLAVFGYADFNSLKEDYTARQNALLHIIQRFDASDEDGKRAVWKDYCKHYYAGHKRGGLQWKI